MADVRRDLTLYYEGVDITENVDFISCISHDVSSGECDCLDLKVDHADKWFQWGPQRNDRIRVTRSGYDTKTMYLNTIVPENGAYRIYATASKCLPFTPKWRAYEDSTLEKICTMCASECEMGHRLYGVQGGIKYEYLLRENLSAPAFLEFIANREGAVMKTLNGQFTIIGIEYAQDLPAMHTVNLDEEQMDSEYVDRRDLNWSGVEIRTPFGHGIARDRRETGKDIILTNITVDNNAMAYRWAKGILQMHNRQSERLKFEMDFNPGYSAMVRVNVESKSDANGRWIIDEVHQNLFEGRTVAKLSRCITGIG